METLGASGRSGRDYTGAESVLNGRLASEHDDAVFPEDRCEKCESEGRTESDDCFHRHWSTKKERREAQ